MNELESIVRSLAETEPVSEVASQVGCALCNADLESRGGLERHEENCPYRRAVEWVSSQ